MARHFYSTQQRQTKDGKESWCSGIVCIAGITHDAIPTEKVTSLVYDKTRKSYLRPLRLQAGSRLAVGDARGRVQFASACRAVAWALKWNSYRSQESWLRLGWGCPQHPVSGFPSSVPAYSAHDNPPFCSREFPRALRWQSVHVCCTTIPQLIRLVTPYTVRYKVNVIM